MNAPVQQQSRRSRTSITKAMDAHACLQVRQSAKRWVNQSCQTGSLS